MKEKEHRLSLSRSLFNHLDIKKGSLLEVRCGRITIRGRFKAVDDFYGNLFLTREDNGNPIMIRLSSIKHIEHLRSSENEENKKSS